MTKSQQFRVQAPDTVAAVDAAMNNAKNYTFRYKVSKKISVQRGHRNREGETER
jgi:hypothetical protein